MITWISLQYCFISWWPLGANGTIIAVYNPWKISVFPGKESRFNTYLNLGVFQDHKMATHQNPVTLSPPMRQQSTRDLSPYTIPGSEFLVNGHGHHDISLCFYNNCVCYFQHLARKARQRSMWLTQLRCIVFLKAMQLILPEKNILLCLFMKGKWCVAFEQLLTSMKQCV